MCGDSEWWGMEFMPYLCRMNGLNEQQVRESREKYGDNVITPPKRTPWWRLYIEKFRDPIIRILIIAALLSFVISSIQHEYAETIGIIVAIVLATGVGFWFEYDAGRKFDILNAAGEMSAVKVVRAGRVEQIARHEVVVGDVVIVDTGDEVPADGVLIDAISLQVDESMLTGEPIADKHVDAGAADADAAYPANRLLRGTTIVNGHGEMVVEAVGDRTEMGSVARQSTEQTDEPTPLDRQLSRLASLIGRVGMVVGILAFAVFFVKDVWLAYDFGSMHSWTDALPALQATLRYFMVAVTLIVVAVPEGLPMSVTLSLALNMRRMLKTNNLVRRLHACETMGAITTICTDKTGTLTQNRMEVSERLSWGKAETNTKGERDFIGEMLAEAISVNSTAHLQTKAGKRRSQSKGIGNPTEVALLTDLMKRGYDYKAYRKAAKVLSQTAFSTERKYMATRVRSGVTEGRVDYLKGAPEIVVNACGTVMVGNDDRRDIADYRSEIRRRLSDWQGRGMRTLAIACRKAEDDSALTDGHRPLSAGEGYALLAIVAISDPVRTDVREAISQCRKAGVDVKMVTGDSERTAIAIGGQTGLLTDNDSPEAIISGADFALLTDEEARRRVKGLKVMSRAKPADKSRLVRLLQSVGEVVAVTGDGTNDAPALNHAHVGLSMGSGTAVAKHASDITLMDDSFGSICTAIMWGRSLYKNIQRFIVFQLTINLIALLIVGVGALIGSEPPLTVTQMLWVNLIMDTFAALALSSTPPDAKVMNDKPRRQNDFIISRDMWAIILITGLGITAALVGMLLAYHGTEDGLTPRRLTEFFTLFVLFQFWNLFNARVVGTTDSAFSRLGRSYGLLAVATAILLGQVIIVNFGGQVFRTVPLDIGTWGVLFAISSLLLWVGEIVRAVKRKAVSATAKAGRPDDSRHPHTAPPYHD